MMESIAAGIGLGLVAGFTAGFMSRTRELAFQKRLTMSAAKVADLERKSRHEIETDFEVAKRELIAQAAHAIRMEQANTELREQVSSLEVFLDCEGDA